MVLHGAGRPVGRWSDVNGGVRRWRVVGVKEDRGIALGQAGLKADDPCEAAGLGDEKGDEDDVFHIGCLVGVE